jgi:hypothetical protein
MVDPFLLPFAMDLAVRPWPSHNKNSLRSKDSTEEGTVASRKDSTWPEDYARNHA